ncbi:uncharacterized protein [Leptinotarsa decemlineata]|uniref:uncharacterized protein n=1 Tax=Leptinotarsa decemlineata TaxID=7539 RepID=UPI003D308BC6
MAYFVPSVLAILCLVNIAYGLTCYNCQSDGGNNKCNWQTEECDDRLLANDCFTITVPIPTGQEFSKRGCLPRGSCDTVVNGVKSILGQVTNDVDVRCETCSSDKCNSATSLAGFTFVGLTLSVIAFIV